MIDHRAGVFLDTGYLVALEDADDENHPTAREHFDGLGRMPTLTTTSYVLDEVVTFFNVQAYTRRIRKRLVLQKRQGAKFRTFGHPRVWVRAFPRFASWDGCESRAVRRLTVANLIYSTITSLDGYVADKDGNFDWAAPDQEVHAFVNDLERRVGTYLYGRRMYEVMRYWETAYAVTDQPPVAQDYAQIWRAADKVVYSRTLQVVSSARTRIERDFDPEAVRRMKTQA